MVREWSRDVRYALRAMRLSPGITALVLLTMALGIGANTAVFSAVYAVVLKPLPYAEPDRLVLLTSEHPDRRPAMHSAGIADFADWHREARSFSSMASFSYWTFNLTGGDMPARLVGGRVTAEFFDVLGTPPLLGRTLDASDDAAGPGEHVVLSHALWRRLFDQDPSVVGRTIRLNGVPSTIVGVMPQSFRFPAPDVELWAPMGRELDGMPRAARFVMVAARLAPGVSRRAAQDEMTAIAAELERRHPESNRHWSVGVADTRAMIAGDVRQPLLLLLLASAAVLAIACANLANLLLSRASTRRRECAIRVALGATRGQLLRQFLTESLLLAGFGALLGVVVATWGVDALVRLQPDGMPRAEEIGLHPPVLLFTAATALMAGVVFGAIPALHAASSTERALRETSLTTTGGRALTARRVFVVAEIALACVLLVSGLLLLRSFARATAVDPGFTPGGVAVVHVFLGPPKYRTLDSQDAYVARALEHLRGLPGVTEAAAGTNLPLGDDLTVEPLIVEGRPDGADDQPRAELRAVTPGYFSLLGIPLLEGRGFDARDSRASRRVIVVNRAMARVVWPGASALGRRVRWAMSGRDPEWMTVVGVVDDVTGSSLEDPEGPAMYAPYEQRTMGFLRWATLAMRTGGDAAAIAETARRALREVDPDLPVHRAEALEARFARAAAPRRFGLMLLGLFAGLALLIALAGVYGVVAFAVSRRRREMSVRLALGAAPGDLFGLVLRDGVRLTCWGLAIGLAAAWAGARRLESLLFGVDAHDATSFAATALVIAAIALIASAVPAWRTSRIAPSEALREG